MNLHVKGKILKHMKENTLIPLLPFFNFHCSLLDLIT